jgi:hypothetical protein
VLASTIPPAYVSDGIIIFPDGTWFDAVMDGFSGDADPGTIQCLEPTHDAYVAPEQLLTQPGDYPVHLIVQMPEGRCNHRVLDKSRIAASGDRFPPITVDDKFGILINGDGF